jgi:hypothetical protein
MKEMEGICYLGLTRVHGRNQFPQVGGRGHYGLRK